MQIELEPRPDKRALPCPEVDKDKRAAGRGITYRYRGEFGTVNNVELLPAVISMCVKDYTDIYILTQE